MDCKMVQQKIFRFIYGESDAHELRKVKEHLELCNECLKECELMWTLARSGWTAKRPPL